MRVTEEGQPVNLSPLEYRLLSYLLHHAGRVVTQIELTEHLYAQDFERDSNAIEVLVGRVRKKLRLGEYPIQDALDLHRRTLAEARHELYWFLQRSLARELRLVLVSHGKGLNSETPGRLKTHVAHWLRQVPEVVAYSSAQRMHGGTGAVYVLLRKGEFERMENRERHGHKGRLDHTR